MRTWAEVYNSSGVKVASITELISVTTSVKLDEAGDFKLNGVVSQDVIDTLMNGNEVAIFGQEDAETPVQWMRGKIIKPQTQETGDNTNITIAGRDLLEELRWRVVGLGRSYNAQTVQSIMSDLVSLAPGWTATVEAASASLLQTARFDGAKVLKAMLQSTKQLGLHIRNGTNPRNVQIGAFGTAATTPKGEALWAIKAPSSVGRELYDNDAVVLVNSISVTVDSDPTVNWAIPMGAGEGTAATTLEDTSYQIFNADNTLYRAGTASTYPIYRRVNAFNIVEYYIDASGGADLRQDTLSFKTIGPIANSSTAKQLASDALANACIASLKRTRVGLTSYSLTVSKVRVDIRPGDLIHLQYKGQVPTVGDPRATRPTLTYIDVDQDLWVMGVQRSINEGAITTTLQVSTIDQKVMDDTDIMVEVLDRTEVQNVSIQTFPFGYQDSSERIIQGSTLPSDTQYRAANFSLRVPDFFTKVVRVDLTIVTRPLVSTTDVGPDNFAGSGLQALSYYYAVYPSANYPSDITVTIDGVDYTSALGGPWNPSAGNSAVNVTVDISSIIVNAAGGLYQDHSVVFGAGLKTAESKVNTSHPSSVVSASNGFIEAKFLVFGLARAIF